MRVNEANSRNSCYSQAWSKAQKAVKANLVLQLKCLLFRSPVMPYRHQRHNYCRNKKGKPASFVYFRKACAEIGQFHKSENCYEKERKKNISLPHGTNDQKHQQGCDKHHRDYCQTCRFSNSIK
ncbi:unnamed protein product [Dovyalis caffra]|uniref:Uncharacterized protein n=1 Tax=Dovyalis caffra TaxID=77055 RepID=A0AAV1SRK8_9ROSI|nr:unnamed protein product [Dovyalis caffra]